MVLRLLLVDDNVHFLDAARRLLEGEGMPVLGTASSGVEALHQVQELQPDVALVDVDLGTENGLDVARQLADVSAREQLRVILISAYPEQDLAELIDASPAIGFLPKSRLSGVAIRALLEETDGRDGPRTR